VRTPTSRRKRIILELGKSRGRGRIPVRPGLEQTLQDRVTRAGCGVVQCAVDLVGGSLRDWAMGAHPRPEPGVQVK
jgi:hypothetical protein